MNALLNILSPWVATLIAFCIVLTVQGAPQTGKIWFDLHLKDSTDSTSALVSWPGPENVTYDPANAAATTAVLDVLHAAQATATDTANVDSAAPRIGQSGEDFIESLKTVLATKGFSFADGFDLPNQSATATTLRIGINYTAFASTAPAPVLPVTFELWVRTNLLPADAPALRWSIRELAANPSVQALLRAQCGETPAAVAPEMIPENFSLVILPAEGAWLRSVSAVKSPTEDFTPIFAVAVAVAGEAIHQRLLEKPRTLQNHDALALPLHACFSPWSMTGEISFQDELSAVDAAYQQPDRPAWVLRLTGFNPVRRETVTIDAIQLGANGSQPWTAFVAHQQAEGKSLENLIVQKAALEARLNSWLSREMPWGTPHFAIPADHERRIAALLKQSGVAAVETKVFRDQVAYSITWYPVLTTLEASGTYNSDRGGNISAKLAVQARDFGASAEGFIANRRAGLSSDLSSTPKLTPFPDRAMATWGALGDYTRENPVRFGTPKNFSTQDEETRAGLRWQLQGGRSVTASATATESSVVPLTRARRWKLEVIAGYRRARLSGENFAFVERPDGEAPFASTEFTGEWEHGPQGAPPRSAFHIELGADGSSAHAGAPSFARGQFKVVEEIRPGKDRGQSLFLRLTASGGAATAGTPVAWWFRSGGDERMRGFELGELAGRSFVHAGFEMGAGLDAFLRPPVASLAAPKPGFDFRQIRVLLGIEHAWLGDPPTFVPPALVLRSVYSYSVTGEYAGSIPGLPHNAKIGAGYGYAPKSSHHSGRVFITLRVPLSIPQPQ